LFYTAVIWGRSVDCSKAPSLFAWPAPFGKNHAPFVGGTAKFARSFEGLIAFGSGGHLTRKLQRIGGRHVVVQPVSFG
jgi:hypothetical protein